MTYAISQRVGSKDLREKIVQSSLQEYNVSAVLAIAQECIFSLHVSCDVLWDTLKNVKDKDMQKYLEEHPLILLEVIMVKNYLKCESVRKHLSLLLPEHNKMIEICGRVKIINA